MLGDVIEFLERVLVSITCISKIILAINSSEQRYVLRINDAIANFKVTESAFFSRLYKRLNIEITQNPHNIIA